MLICWDFLLQPSLGFTEENDLKKRKYLVRESYQGEKI